MKLSWKKYNKIKLKDREEWNHKFGDIEIPQTNLFYVTIIYLLTLVLSTLVVMMFQMDMDNKLHLLSLIVLCFRIAGAMVITNLFELVCQLGYYIYKCISESRWRKERGYK